MVEGNGSIFIDGHVLFSLPVVDNLVVHVRFSCCLCVYLF